MTEQFKSLPEEIVGEILSWLEVCEQFRTRLVCKGWRAIIQRSQKEIDIDHYAPCVSDETLSFFQKEFKNLNTLHLTYCWKISQEGLCHVCGMTSLQKLSLPHKCRVPEDFLGKLSTLTRLHSIVFPYGMGEAGIEYIRNMSKLHHLVVQDTLTSSSIESLRGISHRLASLHLNGGVEIQDVSTYFKEFTRLEQLHLNCWKFEDQDFSGLSHIRDVLLWNCPHLSLKSIQSMAPLAHNLNVLDLQNNYRFDDATLEFVANHLTNLNTLNISFTSVTDKGLQSISKMTKLLQVDLAGLELNDKNTQCLASLTRLKDLCLDNTRAGTESIRNLTSLTSLYMNFCKHVDDDTLSVIAKSLPKLKRLQFYATEVTDDGVSHLQQLSDLKFLLLSGVYLTDVSVMYLYPLTQLQDLCVINAPQITGEYMAESLECVKLKTINLEFTSCTDEALQALTKFTELEDIRIGGTQVSDVGIKKIFGDNTASFKKLQVLFLNSTKVTDDSVDVLLNLPSLTTLDITHTKISAEAASKVAAALMHVHISVPPVHIH
eukprot:TRINITY_DN3731_c0_g1_i1.p1 TRINITY_DN3731_c0_g1~~TRINITY_DN3731_c0_g1_i1.p1  ORF type:complete len:545 (-),score=107.67 TRINITY_DN3731_c0_g1_i1:68-1702(-)